MKMSKTTTLIASVMAVLISSVAFSARAAVSTVAKASYEAAKKDAAVRYAEDRKLCADESTSTIRMQCLRDAKTEYSKSLASAKTTFDSASAKSAVSTKAAAVCAECGKVTDVKIVEKKGEGGAIGVIAGGVAGAVLGHQVGGGHGKDLATIAGAAGGAYAGHKIEENVRSTKSWVVSVHFDNGNNQNFSFEADPALAIGDAVKASSGSIVKAAK
jgi:outer membrane lipoprotein SlyB